MMFGIKFDSENKQKKSESPRGLQDNSRNYQIQTDEPDSGFRTILRETSEGSNKVHATSSVVVKDFRSSVFQLNTIKEEE